MQKTNNFVKMYRYCQGHSEVPVEFHIWSCISMLAACVADRVWVELIKDQPIYPHLFTFLIAPSGIGKNIAITAVEQLVLADKGLKEWVNHYRGKITGPALYDLLSEEKYDEDLDEEKPSSNVWFVTPELRNSMGQPDMAQSLILTMTELWSACGTTFSDRTRTNDLIVVENPCVNWLAGTTKEWLMKAVKPEDIRGGFFARCLPVYYSHLYPHERVFRPKYPKDRDAVWQRLQERVYKLCALEGELALSPETDAHIEQWYLNEPRPFEDGLAPYYNRSREMVVKLAMIFALADNQSMQIEMGHFRMAQKYYELLQRDVAELIELACQTPETSDAKIVLRVVKRAGEISRSEITKKVFHKGLNSKRVAAAVSQLVLMKLIKHTPGSYGKDIFTFIGG